MRGHVISIHELHLLLLWVILDLNGPLWPNRRLLIAPLHPLPPVPPPSTLPSPPSLCSELQDYVDDVSSEAERLQETVRSLLASGAHCVPPWLGP